LATGRSSRLGRVIALVVSCVAASAASAAAPRFDREIELESAGSVNIASFVRARASASAADDQSTSLDQQLLGVRAGAPTSVLGARAEVEYAWSMPTSQVFDAIGGDDGHHLLHVRVDGDAGGIDYVAKLFSVGEAFASTGLGRARLRAEGLPRQGRGVEVETRLDPLGFEIVPRFRQLQDGAAAAHRQTITRAVDVRRTLAEDWRVSFGVEETGIISGASGAGQEVGEQRARTTEAALAAEPWRLFWQQRSTVENEAHADAERHSAVTEIGARFQAPGGITISPGFRSRSVRGLQQPHIDGTAAEVDVAFSARRLGALKLHVERRARRIDGAQGQGVNAQLELKRALAADDELLRHVSVDLSVRYSTASGDVIEPRQDAGLGLQIGLEYRPQAGR